MNDRKTRKEYTNAEKAVLRRGLVAHRAGGTLRQVAKDISAELPGRTEASIVSTMSRMNTAAKAVKRAKKSGRILRGSRYYTPKGLEAMKQNGANRVGSIKKRLMAYGLTEEQVSAAFSGKTYRLRKEQVEFMERLLQDDTSAVVTLHRGEAFAINVMAHPRKAVVVDRGATQTNIQMTPSLA